MSDVKFDIWNEQASEQNSEFGETNTARGMEESDFENSFEYPTQPSVVSFFKKVFS